MWLAKIYCLLFLYWDSQSLNIGSSQLKIGQFDENNLIKIFGYLLLRIVYYNNQ